MCKGCKELSGPALDAYASGLEILERDGMAAAVAYVGRFEVVARLPGLVTKLTPMLAEHAQEARNGAPGYGDSPRGVSTLLRPSTAPL